MGQPALPEADGAPGGGTKLLSLSQQQLVQELQQQIGFSNKPLSSLRLAPRPVLTSPLGKPCPRPTMVVMFRRFPPTSADKPKLIFMAAE